MKIFAPFDRGCIPPGGTTMYGSFLAGKPREAEGGFKKGAGGGFYGEWPLTSEGDKT